MIDVIVPELAESISEASIETWQVQPGTAVEVGQVLVTIETDKVTLEVPAIKSGTLAEIIKQDGEDVTSGEVLARIDETGAAASAAPAVTSAAPAPAASGNVATIKVPELAESIAEASLGEWLKQPGDQVVVGDVIVSIETDKVTLEVPTPVAGVLGAHQVAIGDDVTSDQALTTVIEGAAAAAPAPVPAVTGGGDAEGLLTPAARKILADKNVNPDQVQGTGKGGRITKSDALAAAAPAAPAAAAPAAAPAAAKLAAPAVAAGARTIRRERMTKLRTRVAERLLQSQQQTAMLTTFNEADMSAVIGLRKSYRDEFEKRHEVKLGFMSFFVKAATMALEQYPIVNAMIDDNEIAYHEYCDLGIAVGSPRGLVVPVLRDAQAMAMADIEKGISDFGRRAQSGSLEIDELMGGTFTITNGGVFGSMMSTPIINPPQSAILGVHATKERAVAINGEVVIRPMNYLALSYDHRLIDGRDAVLFLVAVKQNLEVPARMILGL